jgi:diguanylate cyclase (GGDEF)-like protein
MSVPQRPRLAAELQSKLIRLYRVTHWALLAFIVAIAMAAKPELASSLIFLGATFGYVVVALIIGRTPLVIRDAAARLTAEFLVAIVGLTVLLWLAGTALFGLNSIFAIVVFAARLALAKRRAGMVLAAACVAVVALEVGAGLEVSTVVAAVSLCVVFALLSYLGGVLLDGLAAASRSISAASGRDEATGLYNRRAFLALAESMHQQAAEKRIPHAVQVVDIAELKEVNARYGYAAGDRALLLVAKALERTCAQQELLGRYDGDRFILYLPRLQGSHADELAQRIRNVIFATTMDVETEVVRIKAFVGTARYPIDGLTLSALLAAAEADMRRDRAGKEPPPNQPVFKRRSGKKSAAPPGEGM